MRHKFKWAVEYYAVSISESHVPRVRNYIRNQETRHRKKTWDEESDEYLVRYGFERKQDYSPFSMTLQASARRSILQKQSSSPDNNYTNVLLSACFKTHLYTFVRTFT